jgi:hypothetical protein
MLFMAVNGRATQQFSAAFLALILGENFDGFPEGTEFKLYEGYIPVALIPMPDGGLICLAFDTEIPRGFPIGSFIKSDSSNSEEFQQLMFKNRGKPL